MTTALAATACLMTLSAVARAQAGAPAGARDDPPPSDRQVYESLLDEIRAARAELAEAYRTALDRTRRGESVDAALHARILALRDGIERGEVRLMLVAGRHGWDVPRFEALSPASPPPPPRDDAREQLLPPDPVIAEALSREAREIAASIPLPVLSLDLPKK